MDLKSIGLCPQGFKSPRCRLGKFNVQYIKRWISKSGVRGTERERERERIRGRGEGGGGRRTLNMGDGYGVI